MKICNCCKELRVINDFTINKNFPDGKEPRCKLCFKEYRIKNVERQKKYDKEYKSKYKEKLKIKENTYRKQRRKIDVKFKISDNLRSRLYKSINGFSKSQSILKMLGCTVDFLKQHIEKQFLPEFTWENYGLVWEIDHIKPCASFNLLIEDEQQKCFHYTNLQPLFKTTKISKLYGYTNQIGNRNKLNKIL